MTGHSPLMLTVVNIVGKATLEGVDLHGWEKVKGKKGNVKCRVYTSGRGLFMGGVTEQECRDAASQCGTVTSFAIVNVVATVNFPYKLPLEAVAETLGAEFHDNDEFTGVVYYPTHHHAKCKVMLFANTQNIVFMGCPTVDTYQAVLDELRPVLEALVVYE